MKKKRLVRQMAIVLVCLAVNVVGRYLAAMLRLPLWLDSIGTCIAAYFTGLAGSVIAGTVSCIFSFPLTPMYFFYILTSAAIAAGFYLCAKRGYLETFSKAMIASFVIGMLAVVISTPVHLVFQGGRCGNFWGDALFDMLDWFGLPKILCAVAGTAIVDIIDKQLCVGIAFLGIQGVRRYTHKKRTGNDALPLCLLLAAALLTGSLPAAQAAGNWEEDAFTGEYVEQIYDSTSGMTSSEANVIGETPDGCIWIGSYAGLTRYDGRDFEFIRDGGITSVTAMATDSRGRLWVGTNDGGVTVYDNGSFSFYTTHDGLPDNSILSFAEGSDGTMYIGTENKMCLFSATGRITIFDEDITGVNSIASSGSVVAGTTDRGSLFFLQEGEVTDRREPEDTSSGYTCVTAIQGGFLAGTESGYMEYISLNNGRLAAARQVDTGTLQHITHIQLDTVGRTWLCAYTGFGYLDKNGQLHEEHYTRFDSDVKWMHEDYQGNIWLASSRYGVMKLSKNRFVDLFAAAGADSQSVNAVVSYGDGYYCGTDKGLVILDRNHYALLTNELTGLLEDARVCNLMVDDQKRLWVSTDSAYGLVRYDPAAGEILCFTPENYPGIGSRFCCAEQLRDGMIAAVSDKGIHFIRGNRLIETAAQKEGMPVLCLLEGEDGTLYAGSDGGGIYVLENRKIIGNVTTEQGLSSNIILRLKPYDGGFFAVASNSLCFYKDGTAQKLREFPYFNNYDLLLYGEEAYVLSSAGIYVADVAPLRNDSVPQYTLYNSHDGLINGLTPNSWNYIDGEGNLFLCCNNGVTCVALGQQDTNAPYKMDVALDGDGLPLRERDGVFTVPATTRNITVKASLRNYALTDVKLRFYIEGFDSTPPVLSLRELEPIQISNLSHGTYPIHFQILSGDGQNIFQEARYTLVKEAQVWENGWFLAYLIGMGVWLIAFITGVSVMLLNLSRRKRELEQMRKELEETVRQQTEAIRRHAEEMSAFQWSVIESMASLIESRDGNTGAHVINTRKYVALLAGELLERGLFPETVNPEFVDCMTRVAPLHDVGKIKISDVILNKPGRFTPEEFAVMKNHTIYGGQIIETILGENADPDMLHTAHDVALFHHEKWNGSGYPTGRKGEEIPLSARIMAVADVFDALVSKRVYKDPMDVETAFSILKKDSGTHFDARLVDVFLSRKEEAARLAHEGNVEIEAELEKLSQEAANKQI